MRNLFLALILIVGLGLAGGAFIAKTFLESTASMDSAPVIFEVNPGQSLKSVANELEEQGLITDAGKLYWYGRFKSADKKIRVGEYAISPNMTPIEILAIITSGKSLERPITVTEGMNIFEIAEVVDKQGVIKGQDFLATVKNATLARELSGENVSTLEGYLFPETYNITKYTDAKELVRMMVSRFNDVYEKTVPKITLTRAQLVTLASIIEKETGAPEERPVISSVFHNRMQKGMRLQTDPTVVYGIFAATGKWDKNISRADLLNDTPYNTYTRGGLPPGPISNPGRESLLAAAHPARTDFLYFVSKNDGTHVFTPTYEAHVNAVKEFQLNRKAREGKSWRDLKKREAVPSKVESRKNRP